MSTRKIFSDESGKELSYRINPSNNLSIEIYMLDGTIAQITLNPADAIGFINELDKLKKDLYRNVK